MSSAPLNFVKDRTEEACRSALHLPIPITAPLTWLSTETWTPPSAATLFPSPPWPRRSGIYPPRGHFVTPGIGDVNARFVITETHALLRYCPDTIRQQKAGE